MFAVPQKGQYSSIELGIKTTSNESVISGFEETLLLDQAALESISTMPLPTLSIASIAICTYSSWVGCSACVT